jgi:hypothetical protein
MACTGWRKLLILGGMRLPLRKASQTTPCRLQRWVAPPAIKEIVRHDIHQGLDQRDGPSHGPTAAQGIAHTEGDANVTGPKGS